MSRNVIDALKAWKRKRRASEWASVRDFEQAREFLNKFQLTKTLREVERCTWQTAPDPVQEVEWDWKPEITSNPADAMAVCQVVSMAGEVGECMVVLDGFELPRVGFPVWLLRQKGLQVGGRFIWIMRDRSRVRPADIDTEIPQSEDLSANRLEALDRLYSEFQRRRAEDGGEWPEFTGSGR